MNLKETVALNGEIKREGSFLQSLRSSINVRRVNDHAAAAQQVILRVVVENGLSIVL
jgi:hypothetical protein